MRGLTRLLLASTLSLFALACSAQDGSKYSEGKQFKQVKTIVKPADPKRVTVEEFFWYGCQHCFHFEPEINAWKARKPADVDFVRVPASLGKPVGVLHQKAFYTAEALNVSDKIHGALFEGIHVRNQPLFTQDALAALFNAQSGILPDVFNNTFSGFAVDSRVRRAETLAREYLVYSVPTVVVGGKYQTNATLAGTFPEMIKVIDFLVEKVRKERRN